MAVAGDNRDRLKLVYSAGDVTLGAVYDKFAENFEANAANDAVQDNHAFGLLAISKMGGFNSGIIWYHVSNKATLGSDTQQSNVDVYTMGKVGPLAVKAEVNYVFGETDSGGVTTDREGLAIYGGAFMPAGMTTLGLEVAYAQGDDPDTADFEGAANFDYDSPFWSVILYHNFDYDGFGGTTKAGGADRGVTNALAIKGSVTAKPSEKLTLIGAGIWAQRDETAGSDDLGFEVDAIAVYNIYDNVAYTLGFGYLVAGDALGDIDDPWGLLNRVEIKF